MTPEVKNLGAVQWQAFWAGVWSMRLWLLLSVVVNVIVILAV